MTGTTGGPSGYSAQNLAAQEIKAMQLFWPGTAPSTGQAPVLMRWLCGSQAVSPVIFLSRYYRPPVWLYRLVGFCCYTVSPGCAGTRTVVPLQCKNAVTVGIVGRLLKGAYPTYHSYL